VTAKRRKSGRPKRRLWQILGPGLITGASDDDPSGIATYSQAGAQFGYTLAWTMLFSFPLITAIQEISARIGRVTGRGIAGNIRRHYPPALLYFTVGLLIVTNVINLGADLNAMGDVVQLLIGGPRLPYVFGFGVLCIVLEITMRYRRYIDLLKWTCVTLLAYAAVAMTIRIPWGEVLFDSLVPNFSLDAALALTATLGTTISPYMLFWQSSDEAENERQDRHAHILTLAPAEAPAEIRRIRLDTYIGMFFSNLIGWFIIVTASQAADALRPVAGPFAFLLFALGIIGTGMLAVPVLAGSAAYALGETLKWPVGLARLPMDAKAFYGAIAAATMIGVGMNLTPIDPIKALFWSAVLNGVVAAPLMAVTMLMARNRRVMGRFVIRPGLAAVGWIATLAMAGSAVVLFASM